MPIELTFDRPSRGFILGVFNKCARNGYVVEKDNPEEHVLTETGSEITATQFAGVRKGSEIYIKANDIDSIIGAADHIS